MHADWLEWKKAVDRWWDKTFSEGEEHLDVEEPTHPTKIPMTRLAVILGASVAGLLAARVLAPHFERVVLLERDSLSDKPAYRGGTAQAQHAHILLWRGLMGIEQIFPGYNKKLVDAGGVMLNATGDWYSLFPRGAFPKFESDIEFLCASRPLIEHTLRTTLLDQYRNVVIRDNCSVTGIALSAQSSPQVTFLPDGEKTRHENSVADLVVDATGRNSRTPHWLQQQGFGEVRETLIKPYLGYATRLYKNVTMPPGVRATFILAKDPDMTRGGVLFPIENDQYICTLYGFSRDHPPTSEAGFLDFAKSLRSDIIYRGIVHADPQTPAKAFVKNESVYRHYAEKAAWPRGFLTTGDAVSSFNPIYGQGMTAALLAAEVLAKNIQHGSLASAAGAKNVQRKIVRAYRAAWTMSTNEDLRWPATEGSKAGFALRSMHRYSNWIGSAATRDQRVAYTYIRVLHMSATPTALLTPWMFARILKSGFGKT